MGTHTRNGFLFISTVIITSISVHFVEPPIIQRNVQRCILYNVTPVLRPMCQSHDRTVCNQLQELTTFSPGIPSTLLDFQVACHDSISCQDLSAKKKTYSSSHSSRKAFFSALNTDNNFLQGALLLGHTQKKCHPRHRKTI